LCFIIHNYNLNNSILIIEKQPKDTQAFRRE